MDKYSKYAICPKYIKIKDEVKEALENNRPVVALESTIISHGMPYPENLYTAKQLESIVRENGAVPATIAIIKGIVRIGLDEDELEYLSNSKDVLKVSRRDIPHVIALGLTGGTTVASTMIFAGIVGIRIFATGGIGGVHRGAEKTFDISADLIELSNTNVAVVCAGAKAILDIGLTLEKLETLGVPVYGYKTNDFPAFYTRKSGFKVDACLESPLDCAKAISIKWELGLNGGVLICNPVPIEYELCSENIDCVIEKAVYEAEIKGIKGKDVTPFLLSKVKELTGGESLESNIALVKNNALLAAKIAVELRR